MGIEPTHRTASVRCDGFEDRGHHQVSRRFLTASVSQRNAATDHDSPVPTTKQLSCTNQTPLRMAPPTPYFLSARCRVYSFTNCFSPKAKNRIALPFQAQTAITGHKLPSPALTPRGCYLITGKLTLYTNTHLSWCTHVSIRPITQAGLYAFVMVS